MGLFGKKKPPVSIMSIEMMEACRDVNGLTQALSGDNEMAENAAESLKRIGSPAADPLIQLCNGRDINLQLKAAIILGDIKSRRAVPALIKLAYSPDVDVRASACISLGLIDDDRALCPLIYRLADDKKDVRDAAAFSLSCMGDRIIPPVVANFAGSNQQWLNASDNLKTADDLGNFDPSVIARNTLGRNQLELLRDGIVILISYSEKAWINNFLMCMLSNENVRDADLALIKKCGAMVFDPLIDLLESESEDIRLRAILSLGIINDKNAVTPLEQQLNDDSMAIREAAATALRNITETGLLYIYKEKDLEKNRVTVTFPCEYCGVPIEYGSKYCPSCGALLFDSSGMV